MAHRRSFRGSGISQAQRRKKSWVQLVRLVSTSTTPGFVTTFALATTASGTPGVGVRDGFIGMAGDGTGGDPFVGSLPEESTILRVRGSLLFPKNTATFPVAAGDVNHSFGFGVSAISDRVSTSYPGPISDSDWDGWMFLRQSSVTPVDAAGTIVDVKAMRKIKTGDVFFFMAETVAEGATPQDGSWTLDLRLLLLLP